MDGQKGEVRPLTEENERVFLAYKAYFSIKRNIELLDKEMRSMKDTDAFDMMIEFDKKTTRLCLNNQKLMMKLLTINNLTIMFFSHYDIFCET